MKCRACGKPVSSFRAYVAKGAEAGSGWFCSPACVHSMYPLAEVKGGFNPGTWLICLPFSLTWKLAKLCIKLTGKGVKLCGKLTWKILKNKWTWTIFTCGMSWAAWKMLNAIYAPRSER